MQSQTDTCFAENGYHRPVLVDAVLNWMVVDPSGLYVDGTAGGGGHSSAVLKKLNSRGRMVLIDRDEEAVAFCAKRFAGNRQVAVVHGEIRNIDSILMNLKIPRITGFLMDLGLSSRQVDSPERGFSYSSCNRLDMRMNRNSPLTAAGILNTYSESELADLFFYYGEERKARFIARRIVRERSKKPFDATDSLNEVIRKSVAAKWYLKTLARLYQALRIEVNDELNQLKSGLEKASAFMGPGSRMVVISYHSLEDRIVKQFFKGDPTAFFGEDFQEARPRFLFRRLTHKVVRAEPDEIRNNPRARSAKLRAAEKIVD